MMKYLRQPRGCLVFLCFCSVSLVVSGDSTCISCNGFSSFLCKNDESQCTFIRWAFFLKLFFDCECGETVPPPDPMLQPPVLINSIDGTRSYHRFAILEFEEASSPEFTHECQFDASSFAPCASPWIVMPPEYDIVAGSHTLSIRQCKNDNSECSDTVTIQWTIERLADLAINNDALLQSRVKTIGTPPPNYASEVSQREGVIKGIFRIQCLEVKNLFVDPIVYFGQNDASHLHSIWGNRNIDADTTDAKLYTGYADTFTNPRSACQGEDINRSGYWVPTLFAPIVEDSDRVGWTIIRKDSDDRAIAAGLFHETFYYSAIVTDVDSIQSPPIGLRMVAGVPGATPQNPADNVALEDPFYKAHWYCAPRGSNLGFLGLEFSSSIPECGYTEDDQNRPNMLVHYVVRFPSCWDGIHLDSDDHISHMAYPEFYTEQGSGQGKTIVCPDSHPYPIPEVSNHFSFAVEQSNVDPVTQTSKGWRLASDTYVVDDTNPGGHSLHGDWINGWHPEAMDMMVDGCLKGRKDCHNGELGPQSNGVSYVLDILENASVPQPAYAPDVTNDDLVGMPGTAK